MQKEDRILGMIGQISQRLDEHDTKLDDHNHMLRDLLTGQETLIQKSDGDLSDEARCGPTINSNKKTRISPGFTSPNRLLKYIVLVLRQ